MVSKTPDVTHLVGVPQIAMLKNVAIATKQLKHLQGAPAMLPRMGVLAGPAGYGKSFAAVFLTNQFRAFYVEHKSSWTKRALLMAILKEMVITPEKTIYDMVEQIAEELVKSGRSLIIDEADYLVDKNNVDLVRDIYEASGAPILLIGEEQLPKKLKRFERFDQRILDWQYAQPCDVDDVRTLAEIYCPGVKVADDMCEVLLAQTVGVTRRIAVNLDNILQVARSQGLKSIDRAAWGKREIYTGTAPGRRAA